MCVCGQRMSALDSCQALENDVTCHSHYCMFVSVDVGNGLV